MLENPSKKYVRFHPVTLQDRTWPDRLLDHPPIWCSVDLRDGNQSLAVPMSIEQKLDLFQTLSQCGFKEIEIGFPAASNTEYSFNRRLIEEHRIPSDVTVQVLVQAREDLIERTVQSLEGAKRVIIHLYNSISPAQRRAVFGMDKPQILELAVRGTRWIKEYTAALLKETEVILQYSPESFSCAEVDFARDICEAVMVEWGALPRRKIILNLPATMEVAMPNVFADQVEWFCRNLEHRESAIISVHTHNDRGTGIAAAELALLAGADRVEGTLFGNGERTGNLDIVTVSFNLYMHGIHPGLDLSHFNEVVESYVRCTGMPIPVRHPYAGELVFTAFSGSHQDAIKKGLAEWEKGERSTWDVPYLTIDPRDIGREYREVIRVNSQSGKGGVAFLLENECGIELPKEMQREFGPIANDEIDRLGREVSSMELRAIFCREYVNLDTPWKLKRFQVKEDAKGLFQCQAAVLHNGKVICLGGKANGPIAAFVDAIRGARVPHFEVAYYREHALGFGSGASAIAYVQLVFGKKYIWGAGIDTNIELASIQAVVSALNRLT
ncbi:MAG: 2-isopropylmalate synthase [Candidatus Xiphinematobacter sp.]|nr:MAG: 2-isopropylmalate synthase [Candidatus Xiphinematobacter sp.]QQY10658.1 MAG: 2-isopropylmalate synthase [Candidatus Xiphinematobacter sp.]